MANLSTRIKPVQIVFWLAALAFLISSETIFAQDNLVYQKPPQAITTIIDAPSIPSVEISPAKKWLLIMERAELPSIEELAQPEIRIAGLRINPRTNGPSRSGFFSKLIVKTLASGEERLIQLPDNAKISNLLWSPDGKKVAFTLTSSNGIELWVADIQAGSATKITDQVINDAFGNAISWLSDNQSLLCLTIPQNRGEAPQAPILPQGPVIQENVGKKAPSRTYQDLLKNPYDESQFEYYTTSQIIKVKFTGETRSIGDPAIYAEVTPSPDGKYLLVQTLHRPYSYLVPVYYFPMKIEVWDLSGSVIYQVADLPLAEDIPTAFDAVRKGPRNVSWREDAPATLFWAEAQDDGDPRNESAIRDKIFMLAAPFKAKPTLLQSLEMRYAGATWGSDKLALINESWSKNRKTRTWLVPPNTPAAAKLLFDRSYEDRYSDPGRPLLKKSEFGTSVLLTSNDGKSIFLSGFGASPEGDRPFLDQLNLTTLKTRRLWQSEAPYYESFVSFISEKNNEFVTRRESATEPPNYFLRSLTTKRFQQLTNFSHPTPALKEVSKEIITYQRDDGVQLTATLYLPPGYSAEQDGPLPMLMWAYPQEFKSADAAGQMRGSPHQFIRISPTSHLLLLTQGYAILDNPAMPIIGEGEKEPNDTYIAQLVASAKAAIDEVVRRGIADRDRIAIGGHSYGAFMTANLLAHSDLFRAGIARSGAYNRTLTPFGFQAEERTFWEAPDIYFKMSPFMHADKINEPILLIHGEADNNSGTFPIQSERFYNALKGHGTTARLVMLPHESHGYRARESTMHVMWEMLTWLDKYVKNVKQGEENK
ncbi:MAG: prolyl oligopeptidase family serine peptidase [bacterium]|jgi:dipeptidyl aminopeptidase/acylaminoacyl peptidase|nr:prolyl oligopeptidase family serine peptidase [bacterium]